MSSSYKELLGIDGEPIEFEWNILQGYFRHCRFFRQIQNDLRERNIEPEKFKDRSIFMSMFNDIDWTRKGNDGICISNSEKSQGIREKIRARTLDGFRSWRREAVGMELFLVHLKENGTLQTLKWWNDSMTQVIQYSRVSVL